jgi:hypothetical protein
MKRRFLTVSAVVFLIVVALVVSPLSAHEQQAIVPDAPSNPGMLPSSNFYFVKNTARTIQLAFAFNAPKRAKVTSEFASEDILIIDKLCQMREYSLVSQHCEQFVTHFQEALDWLQRAEEEGKSNSKEIEKVKEDYLNQQQILIDVLEKMPEQRSEAVLKAIEGAKGSMKETIKSVQGEEEAEQFCQQINLQIGNVSQTIQEEIKEKEEKISEVEVPLANHNPEIINLLSDEDRVDCSAECTITCEAQDADYDPLNYIWSANGGDIYGTDAVITWKAPENEGNYTISVTARDGKGGEATESLNIAVETVPTLNIEKFLLTPEDPYHFSEPSAFVDFFTILRNQSCLIECVINDNRDAEYKWSINHGDIIASGAIAEWVAPAYHTDALVTVVVTDDYGERVEAHISFKVSDCPACFSRNCVGEKLPLEFSL